MYAVIETGGKQYKVKAGDVLKVEKLNLKAGDEVVFDKVLFVKSETGLKVGNPYIDGLKVKAEVIDEVKDDKVLVYRPASKKAVRRLRGHRQWYTKVKVKEIIGG